MAVYRKRRKPFDDLIDEEVNPPPIGGIKMGATVFSAEDLDPASELHDVKIAQARRGLLEPPKPGTPDRGTITIGDPEQARLGGKFGDIAGRKMPLAWYENQLHQAEAERTGRPVTVAAAPGQFINPNTISTTYHPAAEFTPSAQEARNVDIEAKQAGGFKWDIGTNQWRNPTTGETAPVISGTGQGTYFARPGPGPQVQYLRESTMGQPDKTGGVLEISRREYLATGNPDAAVYLRTNWPNLTPSDEKTLDWSIRNRDRWELNQQQKHRNLLDIRETENKLAGVTDLTVIDKIWLKEFVRQGEMIVPPDAPPAVRSIYDQINALHKATIEGKIEGSTAAAAIKGLLKTLPDEKVPNPFLGYRQKEEAYNWGYYMVYGDAENPSRGPLPVYQRREPNGNITGLHPEGADAAEVTRNLQGVHDTLTSQSIYYGLTAEQIDEAWSHVLARDSTGRLGALWIAHQREQGRDTPTPVAAPGPATPQPAAQPAPAAAPAEGKMLTDDEADALLRETGMDTDKARGLARQRGYRF